MPTDLTPRRGHDAAPGLARGSGRIARRLAGFLAAALAVAGCARESSESAGGPDPVLAADPAATQALQGGISDAVNEAGTRYLPLSYRSSEDLVAILDRVEAQLSDEGEGSYPRYLAGDEKRPGIEESEELDHFRESIRRWEARTGKQLRATIDPLKAEVAARKPDGPNVHPEFHKRVSSAFDDFIKIEVEEMRERRNQAIHEQVQPLLEKYRTTHPELVRHFEAILNTPPYNLPSPSSRAGAPTDEGREARPRETLKPGSLSS